MKFKLFGAAGSGKTSTTCRLVRDIVDGSFRNFAEVYGLSLTKAAKWSLIGKLAGGDTEARNTLEENILTLHSFAYRRFKEERGDGFRVAKTEEIAEFFKARGFEFRTELDEYEMMDNAYGMVDFSEAEGNRLHQLFNVLRLSLLYTSKEGLIKFTEKYMAELPVSPEHFIELVYEYSRWLKENDLWDFTRLLTELYKRTDIRMRGFILIVDEAQDIAPLNAAILTRYLDSFDHVIIAGDDDQAIFGFASATPDFMLSTPVDREIILPQSYRLPVEVWKLARRIIDQNRHRKYKDFKPRDEKGYVGDIYSFDEALEILQQRKDEGVFILSRNTYFLKEWAELLDRYDVPFTLVGRRRKLPQRIVRILKALHVIKEGRSLPQDEAFYLLKQLRIGKVKGTTHMKIAEALSRLSNGYSSASPEGKVIKKLIHTPPHEILVSEDAGLIKRWWKRITKIEEWEKPKVKLSTIHSAKGLEAENVILDTRITARVMDEAQLDIEPERRVAYVGITRARQRLYLCTPKSKNYTYYELGIL